MKLLVYIASLTFALTGETMKPPNSDHFPISEIEVGNHQYGQVFMSVPNVWKRADFESNYYGIEKDSLVFVGSSTSINLGKITIHPGLGLIFGKHEPVGPALKLRTFFQTKQSVSEFSFTQAFRPSTEDGSTRDTFADGHASLRIPSWTQRPIEIGPTGEYLTHWEVRESLFGGRISIPIGEHIGIIFKIMSHNTFRIGIQLLPKED